MVKTIKFSHEKGLHCRPSVRLAQLAKTFDAKVEIIKGERRANACDVLQVLSLGVTPGEVTIEAIGVDAERALIAVEELFQKIDEEL